MQTRSSSKYECEGFITITWGQENARYTSEMLELVADHVPIARALRLVRSLGLLPLVQLIILTVAPG